MQSKATGRIVGSLLVALAGLTLFAPPSSAQLSIKSTRSFTPGGGAGAQVSKRNVEDYARILGFSPDQTETAMTIHEGYAAAFADLRKANRTAMDEMRRATEDTGDHSVFMERMPKIQKEFAEQSAKLERSFFDDLKAIVSTDQEANWTRVERCRRREVGLRRGTLSGESVDLTDIISGLRLPPEALAALAAPLDEYETELDRQLQARDRAADDEVAFEPGKPIDVEKMQAQMAEAREAGEKVKEVNERNARKLEDLLPEEKRSDFRKAVKHRSFPRVYRPSRVSREIDAALKFDDLTSDQRQTLTSLRDSYDRDAANLNDSWAGAVEESEKSGQIGGVWGGGGQVIMSMGDEPEKLVEARKARRELDEKVRDRVKAALNENQNARLPKGTDREEGEPGEHEAVFDAVVIRRGG